MVPIKSIIVVIVFLFVMSPYSVDAIDKACNIKPQPIRVVLIIPDSEDVDFWHNVKNIATEASRQFNIELNVYNYQMSEGIRFSYPSFLESVLKKESNADYIIGKFHHHIEFQILNIYQKYQVKFFTFNSSLTETLKEQLGAPREKYINWLGHIESNEYQTGYDLADYIIEGKQNSQEHVNVLALNGGYSHNIAQLRASGMITRINEDDKVNLLQLVVTNWSYAQTRQKMSVLLERYPNIDVIWSASDMMSKAIYDEIYQSHPELLKQVFIGSIDWSQQIIPYLNNQQVSVSYGGHLFDVAHLLTLLYDYHQGIDFSLDVGEFIQNTNVPLALDYRMLLETQDFSSIDFTLFSQCANKSIPIHQYNVLELLSTAIKSKESSVRVL